MNLKDELSGMFWVFTESGSVYTVDLTHGTLCRDTFTHDLRGDGVVLELLGVVNCSVGLGAVFVVQLPGVVGPTLRLTSVVSQVLVVDDVESA